ncbi:hypothetical protein SOVF_190650 isoform C, partial [Spinacia oleracea]
EASAHEILRFPASRQAAGADSYSLLRPENVSNFVNVDSIFGPSLYEIIDTWSLYWIVVFVETLDKCFKNVCELDIVFNYGKLHTIVDEIIFGGQVLETNSAEVIRAVEAISKLEASSTTNRFVPKSVSSWRR